MLKACAADTCAKAQAAGQEMGNKELFGIKSTMLRPVCGRCFYIVLFLRGMRGV